MRIAFIILALCFSGCSNKTNKKENMNPINEFTFNGVWELEYNFKAFEGLQTRRGSYTSQNSSEQSNGDVRMVIEDELNEIPDPKLSQIRAIEYISNNPNLIKKALFSSLGKYYESQKELYGYDSNEPEHQKWFPRVSSPDDFANVFGIGNVYILNAEKDGLSYYGLEGGCSWDEEHGIGFVLHKDRVVHIGDAAISFSSWEAYKDNGTYEDRQKEWNNLNNDTVHKPKPILYKPHPKYGTLKPSQISEN